MTRKTENNSTSCRLVISRLIMIVETQILKSTQMFCSHQLFLNHQCFFLFLHTYIELVEC